MAVGLVKGGGCAYGLGMNLNALNSRGYRLYLLGNAFGLNANWMQRLLMGWLAWDMTGSASYVGLISFLNFSPVLLGGPLFGVITDRVNVRKAALVVQAVIATLAVIFLMALIVGAMSTTFLAIYSVVIGLALSAYQPIRMSLGPRLVPKEQIASVVSLGALNFNISRLTGPAIGGAMIATAGEIATMIAVLLIYVPFIYILSRLRPREQSATKVHPPFLRSFKDGLAFIFSNRSVWIAFVVVAAFSVVIRGVLEILPTIADGAFHKGPAGLGVMTAVVGAGALIASFIQVITPTAVAGRVPLRGLFGTLIGAALFLGLGAVNSWIVTLGLLGGIGFCSAMVGINFQTSVQIQLHDDIRGRVMSLWMTLAVGGTAMGALGLGYLVEHIGLNLMFLSVGGISLVAFLAVLPRFRR